MADPAQYSFDTGAFVNTWQRHYRPKAFKTLWQKLGEACSTGTILATEEVYEEIKKIDDDVLKWCSQRAEIFVPHDEQIQKATKQILVRFPRMATRQLNRNAADPFVIALAQARNLTVVTTEGGRASENKPKVPFVCNGVGVKCIDFATFIDEQGWIF
jgi:hypothetical protein